MARRAEVADAESKARSKSAGPLAGPMPVAEPAPLYDLARLERAVRAMVEERRSLQTENERLKAELAARDDDLRELNQRRQDAFKRIDDLIAQLDRLDHQLAAD